MDFETACMMSNAADVLEARELLSSFKVSDWPNLKKESRQKMHKEIYRMAYPSTLDGKAMSLKEAASALAKLQMGKKAK